jgi:hypothetical protein
MKDRFSPTEAGQPAEVPPMRFALSLSIVGAIIGVLAAWLILGG